MLDADDSIVVGNSDGHVVFGNDLKADVREYNDELVEGEGDFGYHVDMKMGKTVNYTTIKKMIKLIRIERLGNRWMRMKPTTAWIQI